MKLLNLQLKMVTSFAFQRTNDLPCSSKDCNKRPEKPKLDTNCSCSTLDKAIQVPAVIALVDSAAASKDDALQYNPSSKAAATANQSKKIDILAHKTHPPNTLATAIIPMDIVKEAVNNLNCILSLLRGSDFDQNYNPCQHFDAKLATFNVLLPQAIKDFSMVFTLTLWEVAFVYALFETDIVNVEEEEHPQILADLLCIDERFAAYLVKIILVEDDIKVSITVEGRHGVKELPGDATTRVAERLLVHLRFPLCLTNFATYLALMPASIGLLRALFTPEMLNNASDTEQLLIDSFDISRKFAQFIIQQFYLEAPDSWK
jgi:hypothetical protein